MEEIAEKKKVLELKKELQKVMEGLMVDDDDDLGSTDNAIQALCALKELKVKQSDRGVKKLKNLEFQEPPLEFRCPISGVLMKDPVVAASGQTFEELSIRKWLNEGNRKCPETDQFLSHTVVIPNHSLKKMIMRWHKANNPRTSLLNRDEEFRPNVTREHLVELLDRLSSSSLSDQRASVQELRLLTAQLPYVRTLFGEIKGAVSQLCSPFLTDRCYSDAALYDDVVVTILNISIDENNKRKIVEGSPSAISFLTDAFRRQNVGIRGYAAVAALSTLSTVDSNKLIIGESGAIKSLIKVLEEGHPLALRDAASAILNLCTLMKNRETALCEGAVSAIIDKIRARVLMDEMLEILVRLSIYTRAVEEMEERGMISCLFAILRESTTSEHSKEKCVAIVYTMCFNDRMKLVKINEVEKAHETLFRVVSTGTSRAKRKATGLLQRLNRFAFLSLSAES